MKAKTFTKYSILFGLGILLASYLSDINVGLSTALSITSLFLYILVLIGEIFMDIKKIKHENFNVGYYYNNKIQSLRDELEAIEKGLKSRYMVNVIRDIIISRIRARYGYIDFDNSESLNKIIKDNKVLSLLTDKHSSINNLDELEEILRRVERCCS